MFIFVGILVFKKKINQVNSFGYLMDKILEVFSV
jgi:hypothetical protein